MNKEFEALDWLNDTLGYFLNKTTDTHCQITLTRNQATEFVEEHKKVEQAFLEYEKVQELEKKNAEYKEVLRIIKEKPQAELALIQLGKIKTYEEYLDRTQHWDGIYWDMIYTQEEFDLLKHYLEKNIQKQ